MSDRLLPHRFEAKDIAHRRIEKYKPEFEDNGGIQIVYSLPNYPNKVVKIDGPELLSSVSQGDTSYAESEWKKYKAKDLNESFRIITEIFGQEHTLKQSAFTLKIPFNERILKAIHKEYGPQSDSAIKNFNAGEVWTLVTIQDKTTELKNPSRISLTAGVAELRPMQSPKFEAAYVDLTIAAVFGVNKTQQIPSVEVAFVQQHMATIVERMNNDQHLKSAIEDFTKNAIEYSKRTGQILDIAGKDNVIFLPSEQGSWHYLLTDAIYPNRNREMIKEAVEISNKIAGDSSFAPDSVEKIILGSVLNYIRTINSLASCLNVDNRIDFEAQPLDARKVKYVLELLRR